MTELKNNDVIKLDKYGANYIEAEGKIVGIYSGNKDRKMVTIFIRNANTNGRDTYLSFNYKEEMLEGVEINDHVKIKANVLSYKYRENNYAQFLICEEITKIKPEIIEVFGVEEGFNYKNNYVRAYFAGEIENIQNSSNGWVIVELKIPSKSENENYEFNTVRCQYSRRMRVNDVDIEVGDKICLAAVMTSRRKSTSNDEIITFENFIVDDMAIVEKKKEENIENISEEINQVDIKDINSEKVENSEEILEEVTDINDVNDSNDKEEIEEIESDGFFESNF